MFTQARIKLTLWYMLTLMIVSSLFSVIVYNMLTFELLRGLHIQELRVVPRPRQATDSSENQEPMNAVFLRTAPLFNLRLMLNPQGIRITDTELFEDAKQRIALQLLSLNAGILVLSGLFSFFLAGKTLRPIEESMEEQKRFIADASHELKTPITAMRTEIEVALRSKLPTQKEAIAILQSNLEEVIRMQKLSEYLLSLHTHQENNKQMLIQSVDIKKTLEDVCKKMQPQAREKKITLTLKGEKTIIHANAVSMHELFFILIENAIKFSGEAETIDIFIKSKRKHVSISIKDHGVGITKDDIPHIFDRFYRVDLARTNTKQSGYGLGLSIAKNIVENHHGSIDVSSVIKKGSTFIVTLPKN